MRPLMAGLNAQLRPKAKWENTLLSFRYHWYWTDIRRHSNSSTPTRGFSTRACVHSEFSVTLFFSYPKPGPMPIPTYGLKAL